MSRHATVTVSSGVLLIEPYSQRLLPSHSADDHLGSAIPAKEVTYIALRLKYMLEQVIPCELPEERVTQPHSDILTDGVVKTARSAGKVSGMDKDYGCCVVYCLLMCKKWFALQAKVELWDADLHNLRAVACEKLAKIIIEVEQDVPYLMQEVLLKRFSIIVDGEETKAANAIEKAVDLHAVLVIGRWVHQTCWLRRVVR